VGARAAAHPANGVDDLGWIETRKEIQDQEASYLMIKVSDAAATATGKLTQQGHALVIIRLRDIAPAKRGKPSQK
jgi:hypothetical protein